MHLGRHWIAKQNLETSVKIVISAALTFTTEERIEMGFVIKIGSTECEVNCCSVWHSDLELPVHLISLLHCG